MMTVSFDIADEAAQRVAALPDDERHVLGQKMSDFLINTLPPAYENTSYENTSYENTSNETDDEPVDEAFIAELREALVEAERVGTLDFEEVVRCIEAEDKVGIVERTRARVVAAKNRAVHEANG